MKETDPGYLDFTVRMPPLTKKSVQGKRAAGKLIFYSLNEPDQKKIAAAFMQEYGLQYKNYKGLIEINIGIYFEMPLRWSIVKRERSEYCFCPKAPDYDNVCKIIGDALEGCAYHNDRQIVKAQATKRWSFENEIKIVLNYFSE